MSSLRNAVKSRHVHRERHQPAARAHLGPLEKKKDYKVRAKYQNDKKKFLRTLHRKALNKNPDEFHFHMINSRLKDGKHYENVEDKELTVNDVNQDLTYITHRRSVEKKKIEKLKAQLHILDTDEEEPKNSHILFVDSEKEEKSADPAQLLETHPSLLGRSYNRLRTSQLAKMTNPIEEKSLNAKALLKTKSKAYKELVQRIARENKLRIMQDKLEVRKKLMVSKGKEEEKPKLVQEGTSTSAPVYRWPQIRKK
ncbi:UTP11-like, U3 small nucleolar ribonucleoprotein [Halocaridina rubra]|uniref:U3 small nucleolar RNA-associated protein 11 n=1 Tax=Halocaridina rubra TaxID=373956 RepID=A0AAN8XJK7_HALRR